MQVDFDYKVALPQRAGYVVPRPRLVERLRAAVDRRLVAVTAPAGYGKTTLLIDFAHEIRATLPVCWYTLDRFDSDAWTFISYLVASIEVQFPNACPGTTALLTGNGQTSLDTITSSLLREIYAIGRDFVLIIDDWHLVDHIATINQVVTGLLTRCPNCHLLLASRLYPGLPDLMLLAARRHMSGLDEEVLRFTPPEVAAVLQAEYQTEVPLEDASRLAEQSNGWIAGILLTVQAGGLTSAATMPGVDSQVYRFLAEQVLEQQDREQRRFLLETALLDELVAGRIDNIFGRHDAQQMIATLVRQHIFISELRTGVFRYHPLFREFLHEFFRTIDPAGYRATAHLVVEAYLAQQQWSQAFELSLAVGDLQQVQQVVRQGSEQIFAQGRIETLEQWFNALPVEQLDAPLLALKARIALNRGQIHEAGALVEVAAQRLQPGDETAVLIVQAQVARIGGRYEDAIMIGQEAVQYAGDDEQRIRSLDILAICCHRAGQTERAIGYLQEAIALGQQRGDLYTIALLHQDLGVCYENAGQLAEAESCYSKADGYWSVAGNRVQRALTLNSRGVVQHLQGNYREAFASLHSALELARETDIALHQALIQASLGDLYSDLNLLPQAREAYELARQARVSAFVTSYSEVGLVRLLVRQRRYDAAAYALGQLTDAAVSAHQVSVQLLRGQLACSEGSRVEAYRQAQLVIEQCQGRFSRELALALLLKAQAAALSPIDQAALTEALEQLDGVVAQLGGDAFLIGELLYLPGFIRRLQSIGWPAANYWSLRVQDVALLGQMIGHHDERPLLTVRTLGSDQLAFNGKPIELGWQRAREVFFYLVQHPRGVTPDALREAIWPDLPAEQSKGALRTAIYQLRKAFPVELIALQGRQRYYLDRGSVRVDYDVERFLELLEPADQDPEQQLSALDLYHGPYLAASENSWSSGLRSFLEQRYLAALRSVAAAYERLGEASDALQLFRRILAVDALDEAAHTGVMRCLIALNNRAAAIEHYLLLRRLLAEELGLDLAPTSEAERIYQEILRN